MADNDGWDTAPRERSTSPRRGAERELSPAPRGPADGGPGPERGRAPVGGQDNGSVNPGNNLHVSGVSKQARESDIEEAFAKFGRVVRCQVMLDPHTREPRGFAFVTMESAEAADAAIAGLTGVEVMGRPLSVQRAKRGRARTPTPGRYHGPPKNDRFGPGPPGRGGYGPPPMDYRYGPPPPRDPYDRYGPPPLRDPYDRYGPPPPPPRDYIPPRDYPPPRGPPMGYGGGGGRGYSPPPRMPRYDDIPPMPRGRYDDMPPPPRRGPYDDLPPPPRSRYDEPPPRRY